MYMHLTTVISSTVNNSESIKGKSINNKKKKKKLIQAIINGGKFIFS